MLRAADDVIRHAAADDATPLSIVRAASRQRHAENINGAQAMAITQRAPSRPL